MYLSKVKIQNFRLFKNFEVEFNKDINLIIGENDSGKSSLIDAIRLTLGSRDDEWFRVTRDDFYKSSSGELKDEMGINGHKVGAKFTKTGRSVSL